MELFYKGSGNVAWLVTEEQSREPMGSFSGDQDFAQWLSGAEEVAGREALNEAAEHKQ